MLSEFFLAGSVHNVIALLGLFRLLLSFFFLISDVNTEAENDAKMATFLSEIVTLVRKTTASQPNTQTGIFC